MAGKVVAINTAIIPYAQGIGFAIPINSAKSCTHDIVTQGTMRRPWLGIVGLTLTPQIARYYGLPVDHGVLVTKVALGSPAEEAGMAEGDIILQVGPVETRRIEDLVNEIHKRTVGGEVQILGVRNGRERFFELQLSEAP
jgi:serine protease Do